MAPPLINARGISKQFGIKPLFTNISLTISEGDRIGLIGPNGSGKSTLLNILGGRIGPDDGDLAIRKRARMSIVAQQSEFPESETIRTILDRSKGLNDTPDAAHAEIVGRAGFADLDAQASTLSGGWKKRLAIVEAMVQLPEVLLLDEPTNHLDLAGIEWLESALKTSTFASIIVSHDRYLLEHVALDVVELNRIYADGLLRVNGSYSRFLEGREAYLYAQGKYQESLANRVRSEIEWLRRGAKARTSKSKARIAKAHESIGELADLKDRTRTTSTDIDFTATGRKTRQLVELRGVKAEMGGRTLLDNLDFKLTSNLRVGLVGPNGSGKTTLLRLLRGDIAPTAGEIRRADHLQVVYFDQNRELNPEVSLRRALAPEGDSVLYQGRSIHVAAWAERFLFANESLNQPVGRLSGGERARVLIAQLMLQAADILLLDEPTNDLDIPTLEILEENLLDYPGALVLVTHDRFMLDRLSNIVIGLDGLGAVETFADYTQWEAWRAAQAGKAKPVVPTAAPAVPRPAPARKKLSYHDAREYETIEQRISEAEERLVTCQAALNDPSIASDGARLLATSSDVTAAQAEVDRLFARWAELEEKANGKVPLQDPVE